MATPAAPAATSTSGLRLGSVLGAPVILAWSWFLAAVVITAIFTPWVSSFRPDLGWRAGAVAFCYSLLLFGSVFLHELAHAVAAQAYGHTLIAIELNVWGGHTSYTHNTSGPERRTARNSVVVSLVGPLTNLLLALIGWGIIQLLEPYGVGWLLLFAITFANLALGVVNLLPGLPLDGGRALESLLWAGTGDRYRGTIAASWVGRAIAVLIVVVALGWPLLHGATPSLFTVVWAALIAYFLWSSAAREGKTAVMRRKVEAFDLRTVIEPAVAVAGTATVAQALLAARLPDGNASHIVVFDGSGRPYGVVDPAAVARMPPEAREHTVVSQCVRVLGPWIAASADHTTPTVLEALGQQPQTETVLLIANQMVVGILPVQRLYHRLTQG